MTTNSAELPFIYRPVGGGDGKAIAKTIACAFAIKPSKPLPVAAIRIHWSDDMAAKLREAARAGKRSGTDEGKSLPYASLRAALEAQLPQAVVMRSDLGAPWKDKETNSTGPSARYFLSIEASALGKTDPVAAARSAFVAWARMVFAPWAERVGVARLIIDAISTAKQPFVAETKKTDLAEDIETSRDIDHLKQAILQVIARRLEGQELFEGLGPVYRVIRSPSSSSVKFHTWPVPGLKGGLYSMTAEFTFATGAYIGHPYVVVNASRTRWYEAIPEPSRLRRRRSVRGIIMGRGGAPVAVEFEAAVKQGAPENPASPEFMIEALKVGADLGDDLATMVSRGASGKVFVGLPYSSSNGGKHPVGSGASSRDILDLFDTSFALLKADGFTPISFEEVRKKRGLKRDTDYHKSVQVEGLIADIAFSLGRSDLRGKALIEACKLVMEGDDVPELKPDDALTAHAALEQVRKANEERIVRAYGAQKPTIVVLARREREREVMKAMLRGLFGTAIKLADYPLPEGVHGPREDLAEARKKAAERFAARVDAWRSLATEIAKKQNGCHVLVQAPEWYERKQDDKVNKLAGRYALATIANANVQYLRPPHGTWRGLEDYMYRTTSAAYDLLFGHSGLISEVGSLLKTAFPDEKTRPKSIIGLSVVTQARLRYGAPGGKICLATRVDAETGRTTARVGWSDDGIQWSKWEPFFEAMKRISSPDVSATLGENQEKEKEAFQDFVKAIIDEAVKQDEKPLVLIDSTSARSLWPWLQDTQIGHGITLGREALDHSAVWPGVRIVRVRKDSAARILQRKTVHLERLDNATGKPTGELEVSDVPTGNARVLKLAEASGKRTHYWVTGGYLMTSVRGLSVYRGVALFREPKSMESLGLPEGASADRLRVQQVYAPINDNYRLQRSIDVTVAAVVEGDDPDAIAHIVSSLRQGYGHTAHETTLPAPLSFERVARDYMTRFGLDEADEEEEGGPAPIDSEDPDDPDDSGPGGEDDPELGDVVDFGDPGDMPQPALPETVPAAPSFAEGKAPAVFGLAEKTGRYDAEEEARRLFEPVLSEKPGRVFAALREDRQEAALHRYAVGLLGPRGIVGETALGSVLRQHLMDSLPAIAGTARPMAEHFDDDRLQMAQQEASPARQGMCAETEKRNGNMARMRDRVDFWLDVTKEPVLPVPAFVTRDWLTKSVSVPNAILRVLHTHKSELEQLSGVKWPEEKPSAEEFLDILMDGLRYPGFVRAIGNIVRRNMKQAKKNDFSLFSPLHRHISKIVFATVNSKAGRNGSKKPVLPPSATPLDRIKNMVEHGLADHAVARLYATVIEFVYMPDMKTYAEENREIFADLLPLLEAADKHLAIASAIKAAMNDEPESNETGAADTIENGDEHDDADADLEEGANDNSRAPESAAMPPSGPQTIPDVIGDKLECIRTEWRQLMKGLSAAATAAAAEAPHANILKSLRALLETADGVIAAWEDAQPKWVDVTALVHEAREMLARLVSEFKMGDPSALDNDIATVPEAIASAGQAILEEARRIIEQAAEARSRALELWADNDRLEEAVETRKRSIALAQEAADALTKLKGILSDTAAFGEYMPPKDGRQPEQPAMAEPTATAEPGAALSKPDAADSGAERAAESQTAARKAAAEMVTAIDPDNVPDDLDLIDDIMDELSGAEEDSFDVDEFDIIEPEEAATDDEIHIEEDPQLKAAKARLDKLVEAREFGLAYHLLRVGARTFPEARFNFEADELRLAAMASHVNHVTMEGNSQLIDIVNSALDSAKALSEDNNIPEDVKAARRIMLLGASAGLALFNPSTQANALIAELGSIAPGLGDKIYPLRDAINAAATSGMGITPAMFRAASQAVEGDRYGEECLQQLKDKIAAFASLRFKFALGSKIRTVLISSEGAIGQLRAALERGPKQAADTCEEFADRYSVRMNIKSLLDSAEAKVNTRVRGIDGGARERLISSILDIAARCREFLQTNQAAPAMKSSKSRQIVVGFREAIVNGVDKALEALTAYQIQASPLCTSAAGYAMEQLLRLKDAAMGTYTSPSPSDHLMAVHGPLLWLKGLHYGRSWLPSPYREDIILGAIMQADLPVIPKDNIADRFHKLVREKLDEGSFVAARMLLENCDFYGIDKDKCDELMENFDTSIRTKRDTLIARVGVVRRMVDRVQRMNVLHSVNDAQSLLARLDRIEPGELPSETLPEHRTEDKEGEHILDIASAMAVLDDIIAELDVKLEKPRTEIAEKLSQLEDSGMATSKQADLVRSLVAKDELITAQEYVEFLERGLEIPEDPSPNPRFRAFFPDTLTSLEKLSKAELDSVPSLISEGKDIGKLRFSRIPESRREDAIDLLSYWRNLRNRVHGGHAAEHVFSNLAILLEHMGLTVAMKDIVQELTAPRKKVYVCNFDIAIPDADSALLPDFGSQSGGTYRVCVVDKMPTETELKALCANPGNMRSIILVLSLVDANRRRELRRSSIHFSRRVLVIDEAIFLFALSEPEFRPLTLIECAQPFSFAEPYGDYGSQQVPREMFFGRRVESRKISEPSGSCIVYGGRRLGKTALLRHVEDENNNEAAGTIVAYVNIYELGKTLFPSQIWSHASDKLKAVFPDPVDSARAFSERITQWLDTDSKRRILLLLDEADMFIESDARDGYKEFLQLQSLMDGTNRRFKFVLAGLHNVTRLVHTENPPLKQIASDPQRIGPLLDAQFNDAELLVTRPMAALGFRFDNREDVWSILSHCNYYPVLVQTFCKGLLEALFREIAEQKRSDFVITSDDVKRALDDQSIAKEIGQVFDFTLGIDERYKLIANIMALRALQDRIEGRVEEGMSSVEVRDEAIKYWPEAFNRINRLSVIEDLLDEMEGLGVVRNTGGDSWALRSHSILRLLGNEERIRGELEEFQGRAAPPAFEPRSMRRPLQLAPIHKFPKDHFCPLTLGQEHDLMAADPNNPGVIRVIFGNTLSDLPHVGAALSTAGPLASDGTRIDPKVQNWTNLNAFADALKQLRPKDKERVLMVVDARTDWDGDWIQAALKVKAVTDDRVRVIFVGADRHAFKWIRDPKVHGAAAPVRVLPLQTWSPAMVDHTLRRENQDPQSYSEQIRRLTGGFNRPMNQLLATSLAPREKFQSRLDKMKRLVAEKGTWDELGIIGPMRAVFRAMPHAEKLFEDNQVTPYEIEEILKDLKLDTPFTKEQVIEYGILMGLLEPGQAPSDDTEELRPHIVNPFVWEVLKAGEGARS